MPEEHNRDNYDEIRKDLIRTVIKEPLLDMVHSRKESGEPIQVMIEVNDEFYLGRMKAVAEAKDLFKSVAGVDLESIGSEQNPYYKAKLTPKQILDIVVRDDSAAVHGHRMAMEAASDSNTTTARTIPPKQLRYYLSISRIWYDHPISPLIDKSVSTVKADAAHRAFLAVGKDVVWAVIDSGIDQSHEHFITNGTLQVTLPVDHWDLTAPPGSDQHASARIDKFGHGTHVAGIIAGAYFAGNGKPTATALRSKLGGTDQVETFNEDVSQITGMAPQCKLVSLKVLDDNGQGDVSNIIAAIDLIQTINDYGRSVKIHGVNLSVGYEFEPTWFACGRSPVCVEVNRLVRSGVVVVVAAGNTGYGVLSANQRETGAGFMLTINDPGNADLAITVGSTHREEPHTYGVSYFSSKGPTGDGRSKPDLVAPGERILSCCSSKTLKANNSTTFYVEDSGTSMAAPHVSGVIAAFLSIRREYIGEPEKVKELFLSAATDLGRNAYFQGRGLVDLMRALQAV